ncbi:MAG: tetratricopeptide repeat protein [Desulfomonile sp.]|nr:tetratricopeptide repeat protein [Desulfomonile sp.]
MPVILGQARRLPHHACPMVVTSLKSSSCDTSQPDRQARYLSPGATALIFLGFLAIVAGLHYEGFQSPMVYDGYGWIQQKAYIYARNSLVDVLGIVPARPLFMATLYANYKVAGMAPAAFRFVNAMMLAGAGLALLYLVLALLTAPGVCTNASQSQKKAIALVLALLFVAHPMQTFVVLYIWQREAILACLFSYGALAAYVAARSGRFRDPVAGYAVTAVLFLGGLLTKENVVTFPIVAAAAEITIFRQSLREFAKRCLVLALIALPAVVVSGITTLALHAAQSEHPPGILTRVAAYYREGGIAVGEVAMTACRELFTYLWMIVAPFAQTLTFIRAEIISRSLWDPPITMFACIGAAILFVVALAIRRRYPLAAFGILFFLVTPMPESLLIPQYLYFGYRAILPMAGVLIVFGWVAAEAVGSRKPAVARTAQVALVSASIAALVAFADQTLNHARAWRPLNFWQTAYSMLPRFSDAVQRAPYLDIIINYSGQLIASGRLQEAVEVLSRPYLDARNQLVSSQASAPGEADLSPANVDAVADRLVSIAATDRHSAAMALLQLGLALDKTDRSGEALKLYRRAVEIAPRIAAVRVNLGAELEKRGDLAGAAKEYRLATEAEPHLPDAYLRLGMVLKESGDLPAAVAALRKAIEAHPGLSAAYESLGMALKQSGNFPAAGEMLKRAVSLDPSSGSAANNLARVLEETGDTDGAIEHYARASRLVPNAADVHRNLANALLKAGRGEEAVQHYKRTIQLKPDFAEAYANLGAALLTVGQPAEAAEALRKALSQMGDNAELYNALGVALAQLGRRSEAEDQFRKALSMDADHAGAKQNLERLAE